MSGKDLYEVIHTQGLHQKLLKHSPQRVEQQHKWHVVGPEWGAEPNRRLIVIPATGLPAVPQDPLLKLGPSLDEPGVLRETPEAASF